MRRLIAQPRTWDRNIPVAQITTCLVVEAGGRAMSRVGQMRRLSCLAMSASPATSDVWLRRGELTLRANGRHGQRSKQAAAHVGNQARPTGHKFTHFPTRTLATTPAGQLLSADRVHLRAALSERHPLAP
jgi:hypothetical protein